MRTFSGGFGISTLLFFLLFLVAFARVSAAEAGNVLGREVENERLRAIIESGSLRFVAHSIQDRSGAKQKLDSEYSLQLEKNLVTGKLPAGKLPVYSAPKKPFEFFEYASQVEIRKDARNDSYEVNLVVASGSSRFQLLIRVDASANANLYVIGNNRETTIYEGQIEPITGQGRN